MKHLLPDSSSVDMIIKFSSLKRRLKMLYI